jgi:hypothetical protein
MDEVAVDTSERKILHRIYGPIQERGGWCTRYNHELYQLYKLPSIIKVITTAWLQWAGHLQRQLSSDA